MSANGGGRESEREYHDWEPGEFTHPMYTDPMCRICGHGTDYHLHKAEEERKEEEEEP